MNNIVREIQALKKKRNALIFAHNYQSEDVQNVADFLGDYLELSRRAADAPADVIVFCGVLFMAETASVLCPDKLVIVPDSNAGCPLADMIDVEGLLEMRERHPGAATVAYVNTSAFVKADSDICCTSANSVEVVNSLPGEKEIIFLPDRFLGQWTSRIAGRELIIYPGYCPVHMEIKKEDILRKRERHPEAVVVAHPECRDEVVELADEVLSTGGMCRYAREMPAREMIVGTEVGILHRLRRENPEKRFYPASKKAVCPDMKLATLPKIQSALEDLKFEVRVPSDVRARARKSIIRMLEVAK